jgi:hypothetical protein
MFDDIRCKYPLPDPEAQDFAFQTKDLDCNLDMYTITEDGRLLVDRHLLDENLDHDKNKPFAAGNHPFRRTDLGQEEVLHHGDITFYASGPNGGWMEYIARFTHGRVESIRDAGSSK